MPSTGMNALAGSGNESSGRRRSIVSATATKVLLALNHELTANLPRVGRVAKSVRRSIESILGTEFVFRHIYRGGVWAGLETVSGPGSTLDYTASLRTRLQNLLDELGVNLLVDAGCGDFNWMRLLRVREYVGIDVVEELVASDNQVYGSSNRKFLRLDIAEDVLPRADLVLCRDCLVHLPTKGVLSALRNLKRTGSTWLLATTYPAVAANEDIVTGSWRALNLERPPFNLPAPVQLLSDGGPTTSQFGGCFLGLWRVAEIPL